MRLQEQARQGGPFGHSPMGAGNSQMGTGNSPMAAGTGGRLCAGWLARPRAHTYTRSCSHARSHTHACTRMRTYAAQWSDPAHGCRTCVHSMARRRPIGCSHCMSIGCSDLVFLPHLLADARNACSCVPQGWGGQGWGSRGSREARSWGSREGREARSNTPWVVAE